ncbi:MAG: hypothetical protein ACREFL_08770 [Stellaceae bacterium]
MISPEQGNEMLAGIQAGEAAQLKRLNALTRGIARIPPDWTADEADRDGGVLYRNPADPQYDNVRIMPGDPQSSNPAQRGPYVIDQQSGRFLTKDGTRVQGGKGPEVHIPLQNYRFDPR